MTERIAQLDGLRGLAAMSVLLYHFTTRYEEQLGHAQPLVLQFTHGHLGVQLFFAISGFVIFLTLERTRSSLVFVVSRFSRLYPTYWTAVLFTSSLLWLVDLPGGGPPMTQVLFNLTMIQTFFHVPDIDGVYWTLQVELIFYALMLGLWRVGALARPVPMLSAWVALSLVTGWSDVPYLLSTVLMLDWIPWFVLGIVSYLASASQRFTAPLLFLAGIAVLSISVRSGIALAALGSSFTVVVWMAALGRIRILGSRPVVALGAISYPLYLLHEKIGFATIRQVEEWTDSPILAICAATLVCVVLAAVVHQTIEVRATRAIRSWYGKPRSGQTIPGHRLT